MEEIGTWTTNEIIVNITQEDNNFFSYSWIQEWMLIYDLILFALICAVIFVFKLLKR